MPKHELVDLKSYSWICYHSSIANTKTFRCAGQFVFMTLAEPLIGHTMFNWILKYILSAETKQIKTFYYRQAFAVSILRLLHQFYTKMLNYMNKHVYLPKMVPLGLGCKAVWGVSSVLVLVVCGEGLFRWKGDGQGTPTWNHTYQFKLGMPPFVVWWPYRRLVHRWGWMV